MDIEAEPLQELYRFAELRNISSVETKLGGSGDSLWSLIETEGSSTFLHIGPYTIFEENEHGRSYFDLFVKSVKHGVKTMLWYGYETKNGRQRIYERMVQVLEMNEVDLRVHRVNGVELELESIGEDTMTINSGVPGCGVMIANLSKESVKTLQETSDLLVKAYEDVKYEETSGKLNKRVPFKY